MKTLKLKEFREENKFSQREIADLLGIAQSYYWKWETGKSSPNAHQILLLCKVLSCTPNDLFGFDGVYKVIGSRLDGDFDE